MVVRVRQVERTTQPQDATDVFESSFQGVWVPQSGTTFPDRVGGKDFSLTNVSVVATSDGQATRSTIGSSPTITRASFPYFSEFSLLVRAKVGSGSDGSGYRSIAAHHTSNGALSDWYLYVSVSDGKLYVDIPWGAAAVVGSASAITLDAWHTFGLTRTGSSGSWTYTLFVDGAQVGSATTATNPSTSTNSLTVGHFAGGNVSSIDCSLIGISTALSSAQMLAFSANPWQLFEPEKIVVKAAASASTTTVTVDAGSLTLTGQSVTDTVTAAVGAGTVTLTGQNVALQQQQPVTAGSTSLTGQSIGITITVPISPGTLSLTGSDVTVVPPSGSFSIAVDPGALSLTGQAVTNLVTTPISEGSTSLTGQDVSVTTTVTVDPGSITLTGEVITVSYLGTQTIPIEPGTLSVTGRDVEVSITGGTKGGVGKGKNLTLKQKKKLKAVVNQEWLKAEQTAKELLYERLGHAEPAKTKVERLTTVQSLGDVIAALQALSKETVTLPEQQAVIKSFEKSIDTKIVKTGERLVYVEDKVNETLGRIEKKIQNLEDLLIVIIDDLL